MAETGSVEEPLHDGWLSIGAQKFYFVLYREVLERYNTEEDAEAGVNGMDIPVDNIENVDVVGDDAFELEFTDGKKWELLAENQDERELWLDALEPLFGEDAPDVVEESRDPDQATEKVGQSNETFKETAEPGQATGKVEQQSEAIKETAERGKETPQQLGSITTPAPQVQKPDRDKESTKVEQETTKGSAPQASWGAATVGPKSSPSAAPEAPKASPSAAPAAPQASPSTAPVAPVASPNAAAAVPKASSSDASTAPKVSASPAPAAPLALSATTPAKTAPTSGANQRGVRGSNARVDPRVSLAIPSKAPSPAAPAGKKTSAPKRLVNINVIGVTGSFFKKRAPKGRWVTVEVPSNYGRIFRTPAKPDANPTWNHKIQIKNYKSTDLLHFSVVLNHEILAYCDLETVFFHPTPFEDELDLLDEKDAPLANAKLKVQVSGQSLDPPASKPADPRKFRRPVTQAMEAQDDLDDESRDLETPTAEMHMPAIQPARARGGLRICGTIYDKGVGGDISDSQDTQASRSPVQSIIDGEEEDFEWDDAHQTFKMARYRGKYQHLTKKQRWRGEDDPEDAARNGAGLTKDLNPTLMWAVDGKVVKKWQCHSYMHKQMTLHGLMAQTPNVRVCIVGMRGRRSNGWALRWDGYCLCSIRSPGREASSRFATGSKDDLASTLDRSPWDHEAEVVLDSNQDLLEFTIHGICRDSYPKREAFLGKATIPSHRFLSRGFSGEVKIDGRDAVDAYLYIVVAVLRIWDEELNMEVPPREAAEILKRASKADSKILAPDKGWPQKPIKDSPKVRITTHDLLHYDAMRRNLDTELQHKMVHHTMTTPFRKKRWMWEEVDNVLMREVYGETPQKTAHRKGVDAPQRLASAVQRAIHPRLEFSTAYVFEDGDAELACVGPALDIEKHYLALNEEFSEGSSETFDNNAVESEPESADEAESTGNNINVQEEAAVVDEASSAGRTSASKEISASPWDDGRTSLPEPAVSQHLRQSRIDAERGPSSIAESQQSGNDEADSRSQQIGNDEADSRSQQIGSDEADDEPKEDEEEEEEKAEKEEAEKGEAEKEDLEDSFLVFLRSDANGQCRVFVEQEAEDDTGELVYADLTQLAMAAGIRPEDLTLVDGSQLSKKSVDDFMDRIDKLMDENPSLDFPDANIKSLPSLPFKKGSTWAEKEDEEDLEDRKEAALAIQSRFRQFKAKKETARRREERRQAKEDQQRTQGASLEDQAASTNSASSAIRRTASTDSAGAGLKKQTMIDLAEEVVEIPGRESGDEDDEETDEDLEEQEEAAIAIQSKVRQIKAKKEVARRKAARAEANAKNEEDKIDGENNFDEEDKRTTDEQNELDEDEEEREEAAIAIQASVRRRQAKKEVERRREEKQILAEERRRADEEKKRADEEKQADEAMNDRKPRQSSRKSAKAKSSTRPSSRPGGELGGKKAKEETKKSQDKAEAEKPSKDKRKSKKEGEDLKKSKKEDEGLPQADRKSQRRSKRTERSPEHFAEPPRNLDDFDDADSMENSISMEGLMMLRRKAQKMKAFGTKAKAQGSNLQAMRR